MVRRMVDRAEAGLCACPNGKREGIERE